MTLTRLPTRSALALLVALAFALPAGARCLDEARAEGEAADAAEASQPTEPRANLQAMVQEALKRSKAIGAAKLLAQAAGKDVLEAEAGALPQAALSAQAGIGSNGGVAGVDRKTGGLGTVGVGVTAPLYDGGRIASITSWRKQLAEVAQLGQVTLEEQVALQTVALAFERSRYRLQAQVYKQYSRKMGCLVEALEQIVNADKGRASELVQARKSQQQADLQFTQTVAAARQVEIRLRRFVGDGLPPNDGMSTLLLATPDLDTAQRDAERAAEIAQLEAQAKAADSLVGAAAAAAKPQLGWTVSAQKNLGLDRTSALHAGVTLNIPLYSPGTDPAVAAARLRADAARLQKTDALESRRYRVFDVHDQAQSAFDRARRSLDILRNSELVRNYTLQQWQQLGRRSLFDVMAAEADHYNTRVSYVNAMTDGQQANALLWSLGRGVAAGLE